MDNIKQAVNWEKCGIFVHQKRDIREITIIKVILASFEANNMIIYYTLEMLYYFDNIII